MIRRQKYRPVVDAACATIGAEHEPRNRAFALLARERGDPRVTELARVQTVELAEKLGGPHIRYRSNARGP